MTQTGTFATAIACIDGRIQASLAAWVREQSGADHVDMITWPGANHALAISDVESIRRAVDISAKAHASRLIVVAGHYDCAAHPVGELEHRNLVSQAVQRVQSWGLDPEVIGAWIGPAWAPEKL